MTGGIEREEEPMFVVSPHLDDAVLGIGQLMANRSGRCVTVMAGRPDSYPPLADRPHDDVCGFAEHDEVLAIRRSEDEEAMADVGWSFRHLDLVDCQYLRGPRPKSDELGLLSDLEAAWVEAGRPHEVVTAAGIAHPDHLFVRDVVARLAARRKLSMVVWMEPGYRSHFVKDAAEIEGRMIWTRRDVIVWPSSKLELVRHYESQLQGISALALSDALGFEFYGAWPAHRDAR